jgi:hypothetical protein
MPPSRLRTNADPTGASRLPIVPKVSRTFATQAICQRFTIDPAVKEGLEHGSARDCEYQDGGHHDHMRTSFHKL